MQMKRTYLTIDLVKNKVLVFKKSTMNLSKRDVKQRCITLKCFSGLISRLINQVVLTSFYSLLKKLSTLIQRSRLIKKSSSFKLKLLILKTLTFISLKKRKKQTLRAPQSKVQSVYAKEIILKASKMSGSFSDDSKETFICSENSSKKS